MLRVNIDGLVQERRNFIGNALEFHLSCTNPSTYMLQANTAEPTDQTEQRDGSPDSSRMGSPLTPVLKPAIVASRGTIGAVPMAERAKPASKPRSRLKPPKSARAGSAGMNLFTLNVLNFVYGNFKIYLNFSPFCTTEMAQVCN